MSYHLLQKGIDTITYTDYGPKDGFPILVQHGLIASIKQGYLFDALVRAGARVICIARPGYGESSPVSMRTIGEWANLAAVVIDHLGLTRFDLLGSSSGAPYAYAIAHGISKKVCHVYIYSGVPALYDPSIQSKWPFEVKTDSTLAEMQKLAHGLFFSNLSPQDLEDDGMRDAMAYDGFGIALDFCLRVRNWGFTLDQIKQPVFMRHARQDSGVPYETALMTSRLLPDATLYTEEDDVHFSKESLEAFFERFIIPNLPGML